MRMPVAVRAALALAVASVSVSGAHGVELLDDNRLNLRGFGTLGVSCYTADRYDFQREERPDGPGLSRRCDGALDSSLGLQIDGNLSDRLQATLQAIGYHRADDSYAPELTQANLRWTLADNVYLRAGRLQAPLFLDSESRNVHFTQPWARPPVELYNKATAYTIDGLELSRRGLSRGWHVEAAAGVAHSSFDVARRNGTDATDAVDVNLAYAKLRLEQGAWLLSSSLLGGNVTYLTPETNAALSMLAPALAQDLAVDEKRLIMVSVGARYETNRWLAQSEYLFRYTDTMLRDQHAAYLMAGRRFGDWMPYALLSRVWSYSQGKENRAGDSYQYAIAKSLVNNSYRDRASLALGCSRRLTGQALLKLQMDLIKPDSGSIPYDAIEQLITLNLDFVF